MALSPVTGSATFSGLGNGLLGALGQ
jgi:hypothetical protein